MAAVGTASGSFFEGLISQVVSLGSDEERGANFGLALLYGIKSRDEAEALLGIQMMAIHNSAVKAAQRLARADSIEAQDSACRMVNQLSRTYAVQLEALKKYRSNGEQIVKVQHVNVGSGGQAVITDSLQTGGGGMEKSSNNLMSRLQRLRQAPRCTATSKRTRQPCRAAAVRGRTVCYHHGAGAGAPTGKGNGMYRHGQRTKKAIEELRAVRKLIRAARAAIADLE
jgi:hypothetical protein